MTLQVLLQRLNFNSGTAWEPFDRGTNPNQETPSRDFPLSSPVAPPDVKWQDCR